MRICTTLLIILCTTGIATSQQHDAMPPSPALFYDFRVDSAGIFLGLMPSSSRGIVHHRLYRRSRLADQWALIETFGKNPPPIYRDDKVTSAESYRYKWVAEDAAGRQSNADHSIVQLTAFDLRISFRPDVVVTREEDGIKVAISNEIPGDEYRIEIIRSVNGGKYRTAKILQNGTIFMDTDRYQDESRSYKARILYRDGKRSLYSRSVSPL